MKDITALTWRICFLCLTCIMLSYAQNPPEYDHGVDIPTTQPLIVAHRGASGAYPEHTEAAFQLAIDSGTDFIEYDLCLTKDLKIVCMHESWLSGTTNVADVFSEDRMNTYFIIDDDQFRTDYFTVDFTMEELKTVLHRQRFLYRDPNYNDQFPLMSLEELIDMVEASNRTVGLYPEIKDPLWVNSLDIVTQANTTFEQILVDLLHSRGYDNERSPCFIQSFSDISIESLINITNLPLILTRASGITITDDELAYYSSFAYGLNVNKELVIRRAPNNTIIGTTDLVERSHLYNLRVHAWTARNEYMHLAWDYQQDPYLEYEGLINAGVDGVVTDFPATNKRYLRTLYREVCD